MSIGKSHTGTGGAGMGRGQSPGPLYCYHRPEHPRAVGQRRGLKHGAHQPQEGRPVAEGVSGGAERHRRCTGV